MKKFLLVTLMGMAIAMYLYGVIEKLFDDEVKPIDHIAETTTIVYTE